RRGTAPTLPRTDLREKGGAVGQTPRRFFATRATVQSGGARAAQVAEITLMIRRMEDRDVTRAGEVIVAAFNDVYTRHGVPPPFPSPEAGDGIARGDLQLLPQQCFLACAVGGGVGAVC